MSDGSPAAQGARAWGSGVMGLGERALRRESNGECRSEIWRTVDCMPLLLYISHLHCRAFRSEELELRASWIGLVEG